MLAAYNEMRKGRDNLNKRLFFKTEPDLLHLKVPNLSKWQTMLKMKKKRLLEEIN